MSTLLTLLVFLVVFAILFWIVGMIPLPAQPPWLRNVLYIALGLVLVVWLLDFVGWASFGFPHRIR